MTPRIKIEILSGQLQGTVKEFDKPLISAGSLLSDDISIKGFTNILPGHITIKLENNKVLLVNNCMASIYINGEEKREAELNPGDEIRFGKDGASFKVIKIGDSEESIVKEEAPQELPEPEEKTIEAIIPPGEPEALIYKPEEAFVEYFQPETIIYEPDKSFIEDSQPQTYSQPAEATCYLENTTQKAPVVETKSTEETFESSYETISENISDNQSLVVENETSLTATVEPKQEEITIYKPETLLIETSQPDLNLQPEVEDSHLSEVIPPEEPSETEDIKYTTIYYDKNKNTQNPLLDTIYQEKYLKLNLEEQTSKENPEHSLEDSTNLQESLKNSIELEEYSDEKLKQPLIEANDQQQHLKDDIEADEDSEETSPVSNKTYRTYDDYIIEENITRPLPEFYQNLYNLYRTLIEPWLITIFKLEDIVLYKDEAYDRFDIIKDTKIKPVQKADNGKDTIFDTPHKLSRAYFNLLGDFESRLYVGIILSTIISSVVFTFGCLSFMGYWITPIACFIMTSSFKIASTLNTKREFWYMLLTTGILTITDILLIVLTLMNCNRSDVGSIVGQTLSIIILWPFQTLVLAYIAYRYSKD